MSKKDSKPEKADSEKQAIAERQEAEDAVKKNMERLRERCGSSVTLKEKLDQCVLHGNGIGDGIHGFDLLLGLVARMTHPPDRN